jgi:hypothetical protein
LVVDVIAGVGVYAWYLNYGAKQGLTPRRLRESRRKRPVTLCQAQTL